MSLSECPTHLDLRIQEPQRMPSYPQDSQLCFYLRFSTRTNSGCITRSCKPCFLRVCQMTLASAGGITVAAAFSCHAFHCLETASRTNSFPRPFKPSHCFSLDRAVFARNASCNNTDTSTRAFFDFDATPSSGLTEGRGCFNLKRL